MPKAAHSVGQELVHSRAVNIAGLCARQASAQGRASRRMGQDAGQGIDQSSVLRRAWQCAWLVAVQGGGVRGALHFAMKVVRNARYSAGLAVRRGG
jgi:hypothetical protein